MRQPFFSKLLLCAIPLLAATTVRAQPDPPAPYSGNASLNYIRTWNTVKPINNPDSLTVGSPLQVAKMTTQYFDGLGRPLQTVIKQGSLPTGDTARDLVSAVIYDEFGREIYHYLPFRANNTGGNGSLSDGLFKINPFQQQAAFAASQNPGETFFSARPITRLRRSTGLPAPMRPAIAGWAARTPPIPMTGAGSIWPTCSTAKATR